MPPIGQKSSLLAALGDRLKKAAEANRHEEVELPSGGNLPAGIETGIAQLRECKFSVYKSGANVGKHFWIARGSVVSPEDFEDAKGVKHHIKGIFTQIMEPFCDTPGKTRDTLEAHEKWVSNQMKMLGATPDELTAEMLEETCARLVNDAPFFRFRTWQGAKTELENRGGKWFAVTRGQPDKGPYINETAARAANPYAGTEPLINHQWGGVTTFQPIATTLVNDTSRPVARVTVTAAPPVAKPGPAPKPVPVAAKVPPKPPAKPVAAPAPEPEPEPADEQQAAEVDYDAITLDELATLAEQKDDAAQAKLKETALTLMTEEDFDLVGTWGELVLKIEELQAAAGQEGAAETGEGEGEGDVPPEDQQEWKPQVGETYNFKPIDPKTKKPVKKAIEVEVKKVAEKTRTVELANLDNPKVVHKNVKWDDLETAG